MIALMQMPMALSRCKIGQDGQQMMLDAIKSLQYVKVSFQFPPYTMRADEATKRMAMAIDKWTTWDFKGFGAEIGRLLREFVLSVYPQAYSVDASGRLRRQLIGEYAAPEINALKAGVSPISPFLLGGVAVTFIVSLVALRGIRTMSLDSSDE